MGSLGDDLRVALRRLRCQPGFGLVVTLTLALGIGANIAIFTLIDALLLRSLPVEHPEELFRLGDTNDCCVNSGLPRAGFSLFSSRLFEHLRAKTPEFVELAGFQANLLPLGVRRTGAAVPQALNGQFVTANYFRMLGLKPVAGRLFEPDDDRANAAPVVVLSYRAWMRHGLDPGLIGSAVVVNGLPMTVAGIAPPEFFGDTIRPDPPDVWLPMGQEPVMRRERSLVDQPQQHWLYAIGRLAPGARPEPVALRATTALQQWLSAQTFLSDEERRQIGRLHIAVVPAGGGVPVMRGQFGRSLSLLFLTSAVLLLIATANLANLFLARADRTQAAIRTALGASGGRLIRQSVTEGVLLALLGTTVGIVVAIGGTQALVTLAFPGATFVPVSTMPSLSTLTFSVALALVTGTLFTAAPAWIMSRTAPLEALGSGSRNLRHHSLVPRRSLVIAQVSLSFAMLTCALLFASSLSNLERQRLGFDAVNRWVVRIDPPASLAAEQQRLMSLYSRLQERLNRVAGVASVSYALYSPMEGNNWSSGISIAGKPSDSGRAYGASWNRVGPGYFDTTGTRILRGRGITEIDVPGARRVAVVNEAFARKFFPTANPLGQHLGIGDESHNGDFEVVGVADDVKYTNASQPVLPMIFLPAFQSVEYVDSAAANVQARSMLLRSLIVQAAPGAASLEPAIRNAIAEVEPDLNVLRVLPMTFQVSANFRINRLVARLTSIYGTLALILASLGLYGVTSYGVAQRTREIGVRMALGAGRSTILRTVVSAPIVETAVGLALGIPVALLTGSAFSAQLYGVAGQSPRVLSAAVVILISTAALAAVIPARRAAAIDPARALRGE